MFKRLRDIFAPPPAATGHSHGLTQKQVEALTRLSVNADFLTFQEALDATIILQGEKLLATSDAFSLARLQGVLLGLRRAGTLVAEVLQSEQHAAADRKPAGRDTASARRISTFGTPAWSANP